MRAGGSAEYDVVVALSYYAPYVSGVTEAARVTAEGLAARGWRVLVVAGHHDDTTPPTEVLNGVRIIRTPVVARIGKGIVSPSFVPTVARWARRAGCVHLHAPLLEAGPVMAAVRARAGRVPVVVTYHSDVNLGDGVLDRLQVAALDRSHRFALRHADTVCVTSHDYGAASRLAGPLAGAVEIPPPSLVRPVGRAAYRDGEGLHVGFLGRIVEEKGLEHLVAGFRRLGPDARLVIGGDFARVAGGSVVDRVRRAIDGDPRVRLLGFVPEEDLPDFYASLDVFALPSVNSLEAFGIVQVEAMMAGVPALVTDLPGVRVPVELTGFGRVVPPRDDGAITEGLRSLAGSDLDRAAGALRARSLFDSGSVVTRHEQLFTARRRLPCERG